MRVPSIVWRVGAVLTFFFVLTAGGAWLGNHWFGDTWGYFGTSNDTWSGFAGGVLGLFLARAFYIFFLQRWERTGRFFDDTAERARHARWRERATLGVEIGASGAPGEYAESLRSEADRVARLAREGIEANRDYQRMVLVANSGALLVSIGALGNVSLLSQTTGPLWCFAFGLLAAGAGAGARVITKLTEAARSRHALDARLVSAQRWLAENEPNSSDSEERAKLEAAFRDARRTARGSWPLSRYTENTELGAQLISSFAANTAPLAFAVGVVWGLIALI